LAPANVMELNAIVAVPALVTVTAAYVETVPCVVAGNARLAVLSFSAGGAAPAPVSATLCGDPAALSVMIRVAASAPAEAGLNAAYNEQEAPGASEAPQSPNQRKEVALVPPSAIDLRVKAAVPEFFSVASCASLVAPVIVAGKTIDAGVRVTAGAVPVPLSFTCCGEPVALSAIASAAASAPVDRGLNSTDTVHEAPTASEAPQVVADFRNDVALVPVTVSEVNVKAAVPEFFTVRTWAAVGVPTMVAANVSELAESVTAGAVLATPVPLTATVWVPAPSTTLSVASNAPTAAGLNERVTAQLAPAANVEPTGQVVDAANELASVPVSLTEPIVTAAVPAFLRVTTPFVPLVVPTIAVANP